MNTDKINTTIESVARARAVLECHPGGGDANLSTFTTTISASTNPNTVNTKPLSGQFPVCVCSCPLCIINRLCIRIRMILEEQQNLSHGLVRCFNATWEVTLLLPLIFSWCCSCRVFVCVTCFYYY